MLFTSFPVKRGRRLLLKSTERSVKNIELWSHSFFIAHKLFIFFYYLIKVKMSSIISQSNYISNVAEIDHGPLERGPSSEELQAGRGAYDLLNYIERRSDGSEKKILDIFSNFEKKIDNPFRLQVAMNQHVEFFEGLSSIAGELKRAINKIEQMNG